MAFDLWRITSHIYNSKSIHEGGCPYSEKLLKKIIKKTEKIWFNFIKNEGEGKYNYQDIYVIMFSKLKPIFKEKKEHDIVQTYNY
jgi:hypothetical protein